MRILLLLVLAFTLTGCGALVPTKKTEATATKSAEAIATQQNLSVERLTQGKPPEPRPNVTISGSSNHTDLHFDAPVALPLPPPSKYGLPSNLPTAGPASGYPGYLEWLRIQSGQTNNSTDSEAVTQDRKQSIPLSVSLLIGGIALAIIGAVIYLAIGYVKKNSVAAAAAFNVIDQRLAAKINAHKDMAVLSTDPAAIAAHQQLIANLESQRGQMAASAP